MLVKPEGARRSAGIQETRGQLPERGGSFQRWSHDQPCSASTAKKRPKTANVQKRSLDRNASGTRTLDRDLGSGPWTGTYTFAPSERRPLLSGGDRQRSFVWVHQTLTKGPSTEGTRGTTGRRVGGRRGGGGSASGAHLLSDTLPLPFCAGVTRSPSFHVLIQPRGSALARWTLPAW